MKRFLHLAGRAFQLAGLMVLPCAIWATEIQRSEKGALAIFGGSILIFSVGCLLVQFSTRL